MEIVEQLRNQGVMAHASVVVDRSRDRFLTDFSKAVLKDRYLLEGESFQDIFVRVARAYSDEAAHAQRIYDYASKGWFMPSTPILSNGGTTRGLPISCFLNEVGDSLEEIVDILTQNIWLAARGGGIGSYWGNVRSIGEPVRGNGKTSGVIPFMRMQDSMTLAISQGSLRRGSAALYLPIDHPEISEFIDIRRPTGGDPNRKALNIHHGVTIPDRFMHAVEKNAMWDLISPLTGQVVQSVPARDLWIKLLITRTETGEPYLLFTDAVNKALPEQQRRLGLSVKTSNLCSEITLPTGLDHRGKNRTAVCCLSSLNVEYFDDWRHDPQFIEDVMRFLDNVLENFIQQAPDTMAAARYSAERERSVGLGVMGFHSFLQSKDVPMESVMSKVWNKTIFSHIQEHADRASQRLAEERGPCLDALECGIMERFSNKTAIAPTASISIICGNASPGIEPYAANSFTHKTLSGSFHVRNKHLVDLLESKGKNTAAIWSSITTHEGSVQHLDCLTPHEKAVFKTAVEIDQRWLIELAADRTPYISQAQSLNIFLPGNLHKRDLHRIHFDGWKKGIKSFYYLRSSSIQRADKVSHRIVEDRLTVPKQEDPALLGSDDPYEACLSCQ